MNKYPKVNYIGNKEKIASWIIDCFPIKQGKVLDLFCGGCSLAYALKNTGFEVITNDVLYSNYCISKALIENSHTKLELDINEESINEYYNEDIYQDLKWMINKLYFDHEVKELACLIPYSETLDEDKKYLFLALLRRAMIRKIPYSRMNIKWEEIVKFRDEELSYQKYKRRRAYHNKSFTFHILDNLPAYNAAIFDNNCKNHTYQKDAIDMINNLDEKVDIVYIDPPYPSTMNKYEEFYGAFDLMFHKNISYTDFTNKTNFLENLTTIIESCKNKTKYIAISLNNKSKPSYTDLIDSIKHISTKVFIHKKEHVYKITGKENKLSNYEILLIIEV